MALLFLAFRAESGGVNAASDDAQYRSGQMTRMQEGTEVKVTMKVCRGTFDIFFGVVHRMKNEEMEKQFNKEATQGWSFAAGAARITDNNVSSEDRKHTSGGVFVAVDSNLGAVIGKEGAVTSIPGNEGIIAQAWVNMRGGMRVFSVCSGTRNVGHR